MRTGRAVIAPKTQVEDCRRISIFGYRYPVHAYAITVNGQRIDLASTALKVGKNAGVRRWFLCPSCNKRKGFLFRPWHSKLYLCRDCHNLTYWLSQTHRAKFYMLCRAAKLNQRMLKVLNGVGRKGMSNLERKQFERLKARIERIDNKW